MLNNVATFLLCVVAALTIISCQSGNDSSNKDISDDDLAFLESLGTIELDQLDADKKAKTKTILKRFLAHHDYKLYIETQLFASIAKDQQCEQKRQSLKEKMSKLDDKIYKDNLSTDGMFDSFKEVQPKNVIYAMRKSVNLFSLTSKLACNYTDKDLRQVIMMSKMTAEEVLFTDEEKIVQLAILRNIKAMPHYVELEKSL